MTDAILFALPAVPDLDRRETHWWHIVDGKIVESGTGAEWLDVASAGPAEQRRRIALAPAAAVRLTFADRPSAAATPRQAAAVARVAALEQSLGGPDTLHAVSTILANGQDKVVTGVVDNGIMLAWLDWAGALGADPHHVVPAAALLPLGEDWTEAQIGSERLVGRRGIVMPFEPELTTRLVGGAEVRSLDAMQVEAAIARAAESPPLDLRSGRFARRRRIDRARLRELVLLAGVIPLLVLAWSVVSIVKLESATARLDSETLAVAESTLGRPIALESAESELAQRAGDSAGGGLMQPLAALYQALQAEDGVRTTEISYRPDGTLSATLAAPTLDGINRVLIALQRNGYRVTAVPRQSPDGRSMVDATVRSGP